MQEASCEPFTSGSIPNVCGLLSFQRLSYQGTRYALATNYFIRLNCSWRSRYYFAVVNFAKSHIHYEDIHKKTLHCNNSIRQRKIEREKYFKFISKFQFYCLLITERCDNLNSAGLCKIIRKYHKHIWNIYLVENIVKILKHSPENLKSFLQIKIKCLKLHLLMHLYRLNAYKKKMF